MAKKDQTTLSLIKEVQRQKQEIAKAERPSWNTNLSFSFSESRLIFLGHIFPRMSK
jgi:hypothetical protein